MEWIPAKPSLGMNQSRLRKQLAIFESIELGLNQGRLSFIYARKKPS